MQYETRAAINDMIRAHIQSSGARIGSVLFIKKDGHLRRLAFQLAAMPSRVKGTDRGKQASATRALNHPHLMTVWDIKAGGFRSINLQTVLTVAANRQFIRYRQIRPLAAGSYELVQPLLSEVA